jgi:translocation and assembly module TamB
MESKKVTVPRKKRSLLAKTGRVLLWIIASFIFLIILVLILIQTPPVQNFARKKIVSYLENKLKTRIAIGKLDVKFPTALSLQDVYIEARDKDTLLYGGELKVDISMFKLLKSDIEIQEIALNNITAKVKRLPPDSTFNFQFIMDAFMSNSTSTSSAKDTAAMKMNIERILVNNTRIVYKDAVTGNDMDLTIGRLDTKITTFDPSHLLFNMPSITLKGLKGYFYQVQPLQKSIEKTVAEAAAPPESVLQFLNKEIDLSDINVQYKSEPSNINSSFIIGKATLHPQTIDLKNSIITLHDGALANSNIAIETASLAPTKKPADTVLTVAPTPSFKIISGNITISNSNLKYDDRSLPHIPKGMDYSHLNLKDLSLKATNLQYSIDTTIVSVQSAAFSDQSGFILNNLTADFVMNPTGVSLQNLLVETPGSEIKKSALITYPSLAALQKDPGVLGLDIDLQNSKINIKDLRTFLPALSSQATPLSPNSTLYVDARITGKVSDLNFQKLILKGLNATDINASGVVKGLPDPKKIYADLTIKKFNSSKSDLLSLLPGNSLPSNITLPESLSASGRVKGSMDNLYTDVAINTSLGGAKITGTLVKITDQYKAKYDLVVNARNLQLGTLMQNPKLGPLTADIKVKGNGFKPETANATFSGIISNVTLNNYNYTNIKADGNIANKIYKINASVHDPNLDAVVAADGEFAGKYPTVHIDATVDSIKTFPLHLTPQPVIYHGQINGNFTNIDPDNLAGNLTVTHSVLVNNGQRISVDSLEVTATNEAGSHSLSLKSDFLSATIKGQYRVTQMADVFQQSIDPYFSLTQHKNIVKVNPYNFYITAGVTDNATLRALIPGIIRFKPVNLSAHFASDSGWNASLNVPSVIDSSFIIDGLVLNVSTKDSALAYNTSFKQFKSGNSIAVYSTTLNGTLKNNNLDFTLNIKDAKSVNKYTVSGLLSQPTPDNYSFSLKPGNLLLEYQKWSVEGNNSIQYFNKDLSANNFVLSQGSQQLSVNSVGTGANKPLRIDFKNFSIATLTGFVQTDSLLVNGLLNGNAVVKNIQTQPTFTTDLTVTDLSVYQDTLGNLTAKVNNNVANQFNANVSLKGRGNEVNIAGNYFVKPGNNSSYDFTVDIVALQVKALEGFTKGGITGSRGNLYGKVALNGTMAQPNIDGKINFNNVAFNATPLNNVFRIDQSAIAIINNKGIVLNKFTIQDTTNNAIVIDGALNTTDFFFYSFNLKINADNFQAINSTKKNNKIFYGKMVFSTALTITGDQTHPVVDGNLTINDKTDFTIVLPQSEPGVVQRDGVVRFVDYSATPQDSLFMAPYDSLKKSPLIGYDVTINLNVNRNAVFNVIVDEGNGDFLRLKGEGQITAGIDASGKITMVGSYEIAEGSYSLSFNLIKRNFIIQKGSRIVWTGEPTTAQLDVTAIYIANTAPLDLVQGQIEGNPGYYKQKLPFEVHLVIKGELLQPQIAFDVVLPEEKNYSVSADIINTVQTRLTQLRDEPGELNKQVFALLLLNRFVGENPFQSSSGGGATAGSFAKESVSRLLTDQLNQLASGLIQGVDLNFDVATTQDYTTGAERDRTDFNIGLSKRLLNDRLTVTVGTDIQIEGPSPVNGQNNSSPDVTVDYKLSKDGRYLLRAYRRNEYDIEGYIIETGLTFIMSVDYNTFNQIFQRRRAPKTPKKKSSGTTTGTQAATEDKQPLNTPVKEK